MISGKSWKTKTPAALIAISAPFFVIAMLWPYMSHPTTGFGRDLSDGLRGGMFGIFIGINLCSTWLSLRKRAQHPRV